MSRGKHKYNTSPSTGKQLCRFYHYCKENRLTNTVCRGIPKGRCEHYDRICREINSNKMPLGSQRWRPAYSPDGVVRHEKIR